MFTTDELFEIGKTQVEIDGMLVNMYDRERLLIELIRRKSWRVFNLNIQELIKEYHSIVDNTRYAMAKVGQDIIL